MVCDGASPNRRFYRIHELADGENKSPDGVVYWIYNRFDKRRKIYLFCDVPHLLKTIRNNFENSHGHNNTRNLMVSELSNFVDIYKGCLELKPRFPSWARTGCISLHFFEICKHFAANREKYRSLITYNSARYILVTVIASLVKYTAAKVTR